MLYAKIALLALVGSAASLPSTVENLDFFTNIKRDHLNPRQDGSIDDFYLNAQRRSIFGDLEERDAEAEADGSEDWSGSFFVPRELLHARANSPTKAAPKSQAANPAAPAKAATKAPAKVSTPAAKGGEKKPSIQDEIRAKSTLLNPDKKKAVEKKTTADAAKRPQSKDSAKPEKGPQPGRKLGGLNEKPKESEWVKKVQKDSGYKKPGKDDKKEKAHWYNKIGIGKKPKDKENPVPHLEKLASNFAHKTTGFNRKEAEDTKKKNNKAKIMNDATAEIHKEKANKLSDHNSDWRYVNQAQSAVSTAGSVVAATHTLGLLRRDELVSREETLELFRREAYARWGLEEEDLFEY